MKVELINILGDLLEAANAADHAFQQSGCASIEPFVTTRTKAMIAAAERIEALYVDRICAIAERAEQLKGAQ